MKRFNLFITIVITLLAISAEIAAATSFIDLTSYQKQKYWQMLNQECKSLLLSNQYKNYRTCALNVIDKASKIVEADVAWCNDNDNGIDFFTKGVVTSDLYPNGKTDYSYTFSNGKTYVIEGACNSSKKYYYAQQNCAELENYKVGDGICVIANHAPMFQQDTLPDSTINEDQSFTLQIGATDEERDTLEFYAENLPEGATFNKITAGEEPEQYALFEWQPTYEQAGEYEVTFYVSDGKFKDVLKGKIIVNNVNAPPILNSIGNKTVKEGEKLNFIITGSDIDGDLLTYTMENSPNGAIFQNGNFIWTPYFDQAGTYEVTFKVSDGNLIAAQTITIVVTDFHGWTQMSNSGAPVPTYWGSSVWTGEYMFIFGGHYVPDGPMIAAGLYDPKADKWKKVSEIGAPSARIIPHTKLIWTGEEVLVWGGNNSGTIFNDGARYNPKTNTWKPISNQNAPSSRTSHTMIWTGNEMIAWGGFGPNSAYLNDGAKYNPVTDTWTQVSIQNGPSNRSNHSAVWTGDRMIIWGGENDSGTAPNIYTSLSDGGIYDPVTDLWSPIPADNTVGQKALFNMVWTGEEIIAWGGYKYIDGAMVVVNDGASFNMSTLEWTPLSTINAPSKRLDNPVVWTGKEMIIWGGYNFPWNSTYANTGAIYNPNTDAWTPLPLTDAPGGRRAHVAEWTGDAMVIWGGWADGIMSVGGRFIP